MNYDIAVKMTTLMNYESRRVICTFPREIIISWSHTSPFSEAKPISLVSLKLILDIIFSSRTEAGISLKKIYILWVIYRRINYYRYSDLKNSITTRQTLSRMIIILSKCCFSCYDNISRRWGQATTLSASIFINYVSNFTWL